MFGKNSACKPLSRAYCTASLQHCLSFASGVPGISSILLLQRDIKRYRASPFILPRNFAVLAISEGLRQEAGDKVRVTIISPGFVRTNFAEGVPNLEVRALLEESRDKFALPSETIARAIAYAIEQPADVDVNEIVIRPTSQA